MSFRQQIGPGTTADAPARLVSPPEGPRPGPLLYDGGRKGKSQPRIRGAKFRAGRAVQDVLSEVGPTLVDAGIKHALNGVIAPPRDAAGSRAREARRRTASFSYVVVKRVIDLAVCCLLLPVLGPLFLLLAVAVRLDSPGPVFYRERRVGQGGALFTIYKFRSMFTRDYLEEVLGYDECEMAQLRRRQHGKDRTDPRITRIGRYLRATSLDELPQFLNVLRGNMSLVGPRPVVTAELVSYGRSALFYTLAVPGISGLWQVSGRSKISFERRVQLDANYCAEWSLAGDIGILLRTIPAVIRGHGAY